MPKKLSANEMNSLKDLAQSVDDMRELHKTLSELAMNERYQKALEAVGRGRSKAKRKLKTRFDRKETDLPPSTSYLSREGSNGNQLFSSGDSGQLEKVKPKQIRFADFVDVVYFCDAEEDLNLKQCKEPLADENDQQARSYKRRFFPPQDKDFFLLGSEDYCNLSKWYSGLRTSELKRLEKSLEVKKAKIPDLLRK